MSNDKRNEQDEREFEQALTRGLRRVEAPGDLMARVMAQVEGEYAGPRLVREKEHAGGWREWFSFGWKPAWGALAAMLVASILTGHVVHEHRVEEQTRARVQASREFDVSVQITDKAMDHARDQLRRAGVSLDNDGQ